MDDRRTAKKILEWKPIGTRIRGRPRNRWIVDIEEGMQIIGIKVGESNARKEQNGRESMRSLKYIQCCNASERRRRRRRRYNKTANVPITEH